MDLTSFVGSTPCFQTLPFKKRIEPEVLTGARGDIARKYRGCHRLPLDPCFALDIRVMIVRCSDLLSGFIRLMLPGPWPGPRRVVMLGGYSLSRSRRRRSRHRCDLKCLSSESLHAGHAGRAVTLSRLCSVRLCRIYPQHDPNPHMPPHPPHPSQATAPLNP
jgi:hypothetical protein